MVATSATAPLSIYVLGRFRVERSGAALPPEHWKRRRAVDVLTALAVAPGHTLSRDQLIGAFWPDKGPERGANNLHRALHDVRKALGGAYVTVRAGVVALDRGVWVDVDAVEQADDDLASLALYQGPPDLDVEGLEGRLAEIRHHFVEGSLRLGRRLRAVDPDGAIDVLRRLLTVEPTVEEAHRLLMRLLDRTGRTREAKAQYRICAQALASRLD
ncbi:MAG: BTAD domain-containing putative transcriptional regulator, partial [Myxococcota bacterium]